MNARVGGLLARRWGVVPRAGLGLAALAGVIAALAGGLRGAEQLGGLATVDISAVRIGTIGIGAAALLAWASIASWPLWREVGVGIATLLGVLLLLVVVGLRTDDALVPDVRVSLAGGGWLLVMAAIMAFAGLGIALVSGFVVRDELPRALDEWPHVEKLALVLAVAGIALPPLAASGAALGQHSRLGATAQRPLALVAVAGGIAVVALWAFGLLLGALWAQP
ncbi:MAG: hypothetical protein OEM67_02720 [Thermoleophilia bacterium]|nr:hypothetical protein [Thermoleophilia bacterium]MDH3724238.1 hypothetical protein [Thermoleophilia bacterium]